MRTDGRLEMFRAHSAEIRRWGHCLICGVDEVGRGALAGPVAAGAVVLRDTLDIGEIDDSKRLTAQQRRRLAPLIRARAVAAHVGYASAREIDRLGIARATRLAMLRAIEGLAVAPDHLVLDAFALPAAGVPQIATAHADSLYEEVAAASIVAKVERDALMERISAMHPAYGWAENRGYGARAHLQAIARLGLTPWHRRSFCGQFLQEAAGDAGVGQK